MKNEQDSNTILYALGDHALRVVRSEIDQPHKTLKSLDARYESKSTATRLAKKAELVSVKFLSSRDDIAVHGDRMATILEKIWSINTVLNDALAIRILVDQSKSPF